MNILSHKITLAYLRRSAAVSRSRLLRQKLCMAVFIMSRRVTPLLVTMRFMTSFPIFSWCFCSAVFAISLFFLIPGAKLLLFFGLCKFFEEKSAFFLFVFTKTRQSLLQKVAQAINCLHFFCKRLAYVRKSS